MRFRLLIVDDHEFYLQLTKSYLEEKGYIVDTAKSGEEAIRKIQTLDGSYALVLLDYLMDGKDGLETAQDIFKLFPEQFIVIMSNDTSREIVMESWKVGAVEFIDKSLSPDDRLTVISKWCQKFRDKKLGVQFRRSEASRLIESIGLVGQSKAMADIAETVINFQSNRKDVLILGESGTGKERIALALSKNSPHFFPVSCTSYNGDANLMEAELFGVEKGAYTGAVPKTGIFEEANGGTVFLDEIHTLSPKGQEKLLRALQDKKIRPLGGKREIELDLRIIAASKPNLKDLVKNGNFLEDLFYRLEVLQITIPKLHDRKEDIAPLILHYSKKYQAETGEEKIISQEAVKCMEKYPWPGNVRELGHAIERISYTVKKNVIGVEDLDARFKIASREDIQIAKRKAKFEMDNLERNQVLAVLKEAGSQREAARRFGMKSTTFHHLLKKLGITKTAREQKANV